MKIKFNLIQIGTFVAILLIAYISISAMIWQYSSTSTTLVSTIMLFVTICAVYALCSKPIDMQSVEMVLLGYYVYIITTCVFNGYIKTYLQQPTVLFTPVYWVFIFVLFKETVKRKILSVKNFLTIFFVMTIVCFVLFCQYYYTKQSSKYLLSGLNNVYYLLFMFPILLMSNSKKVVIVGVVLNVIAVLLSGKRCALIAMAAALVIWKRSGLGSRLNYRIGMTQLFKMFFYIVLAIAAIYGVLAIVEKLELDIFQRMESLLTGEDSGGSGRTSIWSTYWEYMKSDSLWNNLIGRGYNATKMNPELRILGMTWAHNDFLQVLFDYGIIGVSVFILIIIKLFMTAGKMKRGRYCYYKPFLVSLIIFLICCCFSMVTLQPQWLLPMAAFWGVVIGDFELERTGG